MRESIVSTTTRVDRPIPGVEAVAPDIRQAAIDAFYRPNQDIPWRIRAKYPNSRGVLLDCCLLGYIVLKLDDDLERGGINVSDWTRVVPVPDGPVPVLEVLTARDEIRNVYTRFDDIMLTREEAEIALGLLTD